MLVNGERLHVHNDKENDIDINDIESLKKTFSNEGSISLVTNTNRESLSLSMRARKAKLCSDEEAESGAERYIKLLNAPECRLFFLKVMYYLPYGTRERILEASQRNNVRSPKRFFTYCAKRELQKLGY